MLLSQAEMKPEIHVDICSFSCCLLPAALVLSSGFAAIRSHLDVSEMCCHLKPHRSTQGLKAMSGSVVLIWQGLC